MARLTYGMWAWHRGRMEGEVSIWVAARHDTGEELSRAGIILLLAAGAAWALSYTRLPGSLILLLLAATWIALVVFGFTRVLRLVRSGREDG